jgi:hypothetical protein
VLFFLVLGVVALYTSCVLGLRPFALSINSYFIKKKIAQGDLLSPLLFVLVMEALSKMVNATVEQGYQDFLWERGCFFRFGGLSFSFC